VAVCRPRQSTNEQSSLFLYRDQKVGAWSSYWWILSTPLGVQSWPVSPASRVKTIGVRSGTTSALLNAWLDFALPTVKLFSGQDSHRPFRIF
jgi:hypothetical protein